MKAARKPEVLDTFSALSWIVVRGQQHVVLVRLEKTYPLTLIGSAVLIDGERYRVIGAQAQKAVAGMPPAMQYKPGVLGLVVERATA